jgi:hypothetical protein
MNDHIKITADIPPDASPAEKTQLRAKAIDGGLRAAAGDPAIRLRMILGEAYQRYLAIARWAAEEIAKDEAKAPGLMAQARLYGLLFPMRPGLNAGERTVLQAIATETAGQLEKFINQPPPLLDHEDAGETRS